VVFQPFFSRLELKRVRVFHLKSTIYAVTRDGDQCHLPSPGTFYLWLTGTDWALHASVLAAGRMPTPPR
ncbi:MAG TPA: hypothetical protein VIP31_09340, partial [Acidovorax sp.]